MNECNRIDYNRKFINDSMKQLRRGEIIFVLTRKRKIEIEKAIDDEGLDVTTLTHTDHWSYKLNKEETK